MAASGLHKATPLGGRPNDVLAPFRSVGCIPSTPAITRPPSGSQRRRTSPSGGPSGRLARIGAWCYDHRKSAVGIWFAALILVFAAAGAIGAAYDASPDVPAGERRRLRCARAVLPSWAPRGGSGTIVFRADQGVDDPVTAAMEELFATVNAGFPDQDGNPQHPGPPSSRPTPSKAARRSSARDRWPGSSPTPRSTWPPMSA